MSVKSLTNIRTQFLQCFKDYGCIEEDASKISSGIDPTVIFVGSTTNSLKKYILNEIPVEGIVSDQPSMRFRETKYLFDKVYYPQYGAFFNELGVLTRHENSQGLCNQFHNYFTDYLNIDEKDLLVRINTEDKDLLKLAENTFQNIEFNSMPEKYYRHVIGEKGYVGRNFNIAIKNESNQKFEDAGNFLSFEKDGKDNFLEIGLGDTVIQKAMKGYDHVLHCYDMDVPKNLIAIEALNYTNAVIVTSVLYNEGLCASNKSSQERLLSKYIRYLSLMKHEGKVTYDDIHGSVESFEKNYHGACIGAGDNILSDLSEKEDIFKKTLIVQKLFPG